MAAENNQASTTVPEFHRPQAKEPRRQAHREASCNARGGRAVSRHGHAAVDCTQRVVPDVPGRARPLLGDGAARGRGRPEPGGGRAVASSLRNARESAQRAGRKPFRAVQRLRVRGNAPAHQRPTTTATHSSNARARLLLGASTLALTSQDVRSMRPHAACRIATRMIRHDFRNHSNRAQTVTTVERDC